MKRLLFGVAAVAAAALVWTGSVLAAPKGKKADKGDAEESAALADKGGVDKKRFESYLKERLAKINDHHKARMDFFTRETDTWNSFWNKVRDDRRNFEVRITRQTLDLFESLSSLAPKDHPLTISDFERLQANVIKSFEAQQREKTAEFFSARNERWSEFALEQERERGEFLAESESGWLAHKEHLRNPTSQDASRGRKRKAAAVEEEAEPEEEPQEIEKPKRRPAPAPKPKTSPIGGQDMWN